MKTLSNWIKFLFICLFFFTPLIFTYSNSELFELPKMYLVYTLTIFILTLHLINVLKNKTFLFRKNFFLIPLTLFFLSQLISTILSVDPHTSFFGYYSRLNGGLLSLISYLVLYLVLTVYIDKPFKNKLINFSLLSGFFVSIYAIAQHFGIDKNLWVQDVQSRVFSTLGQPNWLAAFLCILIPFSLTQFLESLKSKKIWLIFYFLILNISFYLSLLFTKSKSGIIAALISIFVYFGILFIHSLKTKTVTQKIVPLLPVLFSYILLSVLVSNPIKDRIFPKNIIPNPPRTDIVITPSEDIRKIVWTGAVDLWKKYPYFGTGTETFAYTYYWTRLVSHNLTSEWDFLYNKAHNEYLNYLATTGTVGLVTYLIIIFTVFFVLTIKIINHKSSLEIRNWSLAILSSFISILVTNFAGFSVVVTSLFFFLLPTFILIDSPNDTKNINQPIKMSLFKKLSSFIIIIACFLLLQKTVYYYLADISFSLFEKADTQNNYQEANQYIAASLRLNPTEPIYYSKSALINSKIAITSTASKQSDQSLQYINTAISNSDQAIKISPTNINLWKERAQTFYYLSTLDSKYFQTAINALSQVTVLSPTDAKTYYLLGQFLESANLNTDAIPFYQKAIELKPNYDHAYFALGKIYFDQKNYELAKPNLDQVLKYAPTSNEAQNLIDQIKKIKK